MNVPCSPTPVGPPRSATTALRCCLPPNGRRRLPRQILISGLNHTARTLAVYASQGGLPHRHARLASGGWPTLPGGTAYPPGPIERFQVISSSFPRLRLAHPFHSIEITGIFRMVTRLPVSPALLALSLRANADPGFKFRPWHQAGRTERCRPQAPRSIGSPALPAPPVDSTGLFPPLARRPIEIYDRY